MDGGSVQPMMTGGSAFGCGAESVGRARRPSRLCRIGWRRPGTTPSIATNRPVRIAAGESAEQAAPHCKDPTRLRIPIACADGHNGDCSACGATLILPFKEPRSVADSAPLLAPCASTSGRNGSAPRLTFQYHDALEQTRFQISSGLDAHCASSVNLESGVW